LPNCCPTICIILVNQCSNGFLNDSFFLYRKVEYYLLKVIYSEIGKEIPKNLHARKGSVAYHEIYEATKEYYRSLKKSGKY
jgi:hypothetical protein